MGIIAERKTEISSGTGRNGVTVSFISHKDAIQKDVISALERNTIKACQLVEREAKINVSQTPPKHPQVDTGRLRASITYFVEQEYGKVWGRVGTNVFYGRYLEYGTIDFRGHMPPYPWLMPAYENQKQNIIKLLGEATIGGLT